MEDGSGSVGDGEFVVAGRDAAPLLDQCERPLDDVAVFVGVFVERRPAAALGAFVFADGDLITLLGDHGPDPAGAEHAPVHSAAVGLVAQDSVGPGA